MKRYRIKKRTSCMSELAARLGRIERIVSGKPADDIRYYVYDGKGYYQGEYSSDEAERYIEYFSDWSMKKV